MVYPVLTHSDGAGSQGEDGTGQPQQERAILFDDAAFEQRGHRDYGITGGRSEHTTGPRRTSPATSIFIMAAVDSVNPW